MNDEQLTNMLRELDEPFADNGFTDYVMTRLPARSFMCWRVPLFASAYLLGCALVLALFPLSALAGLAAQLVAAPELVIAVVGGLSPLSWLIARELVSG